MPEPLEINPLRGYGAVAAGIHRFSDARTHRSCLADGGAAKFITLWQRTEAGWKITRVISYDHH